MNATFWIPEFKEFILYFLTVVFIVLLVKLFHHNRVQQIIRQSSRCLRERSIGQKGGVYSVSAFTRDNEPLYTVSYDVKNKSSSVECACKKGPNSNTFSTKVYNLRDPTAGTSNTQKVCLCDTYLESKEKPTYYSGYPGLIRYMYSNDTSFFQNALGF